MATPTLSGTGPSGSVTATFISLKGQAEPADVQVEDISRPGIDGSAFRQMQKRAEPFEMIGIADFDTIAHALTDATRGYNAIHSLRGTLVSVIDDYSQSLSNVMLLEVTRDKLEPLVTGLGGLVSGSGARALLTVRLKLQMTS